METVVETDLHQTPRVGRRFGHTIDVGNADADGLLHEHVATAGEGRA
jgi:hypothetical protein